MIIGPPPAIPSTAEDDPVLSAYLERRENLVRFFAARSGSFSAAEDLSQELYLKLAARDVIGQVENPVALLYRIATNLMLDRVRSDSRAAARDAAWRQTAHTELAGQDIVEEPAADVALASKQRLQQLITLAEGLPPQMGRAFRLHKLEGLSHAQTAQVMGLSVKAVEKHISAALKAITRGLRR
jgi:RNA polymerase sigma factor (sigma-70 family)